MTTPSRSRRFVGLLGATVLLPLAVMLLGIWEQQRAEADWLDLDTERLRLTRTIEHLEARAPPGAQTDYRIQLSLHGQLYGGPFAVTKAREARDEVATLAKVMDLRRLLPPVVIWGAGLAAALSALGLGAGAVFGRLGRTSREVLVRGFALVRHVLPALLAIQVVLGTAAFMAAVVFEAAALAQPGIGTDEIKVLGVAAIAVLGSLFIAGSTLAGLGRALSAFEPDPIPILGRLISPAEAPGLWRLVETLAGQLGALKPDAIVVGLTEGFFVSAGPKILDPGSETIGGRTLYVPLPYLPFLRRDELASIIGHELAHFAGGDTAYSVRFLPIYAGVGRSLEAVAAAGAGTGSAFGLLSPAMRLGMFVMDQFHFAVRHWSRAREFAADAVGSRPTSPEAAVRALLRVGAVEPRIIETLNAAAKHPEGAPDDLVQAVFDRGMEHGLADPAAHLETEQPHPTDTHPPTRERIAKLGCSLTPDLLAAAAASSGEPDGLTTYFADPAALSRVVTADFLTAVRRHDEAYQAHLAALAAEVSAEERVLQENTRRLAIFCTATGAVFILAAFALGLFGLPGLSWGEARFAALIPLVSGAAFAAFGLFRLRRGERVFMILRPEAVVVPGLDRPIAWCDIADFDMTTRGNGVVTRLLLPPNVSFPDIMPGGRGVKLDRQRRIVTITAGVPRKMSVQNFVDLIVQYRRAAQARQLLADADNASSRLASAPTAQ